MDYSVDSPYHSAHLLSPYPELHSPRSSNTLTALCPPAAPSVDSVLLIPSLEPQFVSDHGPLMTISNNENQTVAMKRVLHGHAAPAVEDPKSAYGQARAFMEHFTQFCSGKAVSS